MEKTFSLNLTPTIFMGNPQLRLSEALVTKLDIETTIRLRAHCTLGPLVGFYNTYITVKLTISRIECHLLGENGYWIILLYAIDYLPLISNRVFVNLYIYISEYGAQICKFSKPYSFKVINIVLIHIFK